MKTFTFALLLMILAACSPSPNIKSGMQANLASHKPQFTDASIEEISKLKPQIIPPIKIAITQPSGAMRSIWFDNTNEEEIKEIESWLPRLKAAGLARDLEIIPSSLDGACNRQDQSNSECIRKAAARLQADAVLSIEYSVETDKYVNPLSMFNITLIGLWLAPGHHRDSYAIYDATLMDTKNGYIYGIARGEGEAKTIRPYMYADSDPGRSEARMLALKDLGNKIAEKASSILKQRAQ